MGMPSSKPSNSSSNTIVLCKERVQCIKQTIDSRYAFSAAHLSYIHSLKRIGTALRKLVECDISIDPSNISTSEQDRTPSRSSYASSSPVQYNSPFDKSLAVNVPRLLTVTASPLIKEDENEASSSWDFFNSNDKEVAPNVIENLNFENGMGFENASEFITHRAKDLLSSMKEIEYRFFRASDSGNEMSRLLETNKIRLHVQDETMGKSPSCEFLTTFHGLCCKAENIFKQELSQNLEKIVTWNRSISSLSSSSSSKDCFQTLLKDGDNESNGNFIGEFYMISGSHSATLDRLYAWERKLYDEVKTSESIVKIYDHKCNQLKSQFAKNFNTHLIDKTRAIAKDLYSQIKVAMQTIDLISKKIEKIRDEELQPQLVEFTQGLIRMWKAMLECHHTQFITISLAYHAANSKQDSSNKPFDKALLHLQIEVGYFASSFINLVNNHKLYVESLNTYIHKCILQPQEQRHKIKNKLAFFPRKIHHESLPPIFIVCQYWLNGLKSLPSEELCGSIKGIVFILIDLVDQQMKLEKKVDDDEVEEYGEGFSRCSNLDRLKIGLTCLFDRLAKFSEASFKVFEEVKQVNEMAYAEYCGKLK